MKDFNKIDVTDFYSFLKDLIVATVFMVYDSVERYYAFRLNET